MARKKVHIFLSDEAKEYLSTQARSLEYVSPYVKSTMRGIGDYIAALARCNFEDTRPQDVKNMDIPLLESGRLPEWSMSNVRKPTYISVPEEAIERLRAIAIEFGITNTNRPDSVELLRSPVSAMLEAVGIGWLTPTNMEHCKHPPRGRYWKTRRDVAW